MPEYRPMATDLPDGPFIRAYLECAEWAGLADEDREALELAVSPQWAPEAIAQAQRECDDFRALCAREGIELGDPEQDGQDFFLTRNRHGAGFWDRGYGPRGDALTKLAHSFGDASVWFDAEAELLYF